MRLRARQYVEGGPCANACGRTWHRRQKTGGGLCSACHTARRTRNRKAPPPPERLCACGCGRSFVPKNTSHEFLDHSHGDAVYKAPLRITSRATKADRHPNTVLIWRLREEMDADGKEGLCIYCERRLEPPRVHVCGDEECARLYNSDWKRGRTMNERLAREKEQAA